MMRKLIEIRQIKVPIKQGATESIVSILKKLRYD